MLLSYKCYWSLLLLYSLFFVSFVFFSGVFIFFGTSKKSWYYLWQLSLNRPQYFEMMYFQICDYFQYFTYSQYFQYCKMMLVKYGFNMNIFVCEYLLHYFICVLSFINFKVCLTILGRYTLKGKYWVLLDKLMLIAIWKQSNTRKRVKFYYKFSQKTIEWGKNLYLTHFSTVYHFYTPWKRQKNKGFLRFSRGYRNGVLG